MSLSNFTNVTHFPLKVLSQQSIWVPDLLPLSVCVCVCYSCLHTPQHFFWKSVFVCVCLCVYALRFSIPPVHRGLAEQIDTMLGFLAICKSAVTVMRAAQRRWRGDKCQHVSEEWHRIPLLGTWEMFTSTLHMHDKAKFVDTRKICPHIYWIGKHTCALTLWYMSQRFIFTKRVTKMGIHCGVSMLIHRNTIRTCQEELHLSFENLCVCVCIHMHMQVVTHVSMFTWKSFHSCHSVFHSHTHTQECLSAAPSVVGIVTCVSLNFSADKK